MVHEGYRIFYCIFTCLTLYRQTYSTGTVKLGAFQGRDPSITSKEELL